MSPPLNPSPLPKMKKTMMRLPLSAQGTWRPRFYENGKLNALYASYQLPVAMVLVLFYLRTGTDPTAEDLRREVVILDNYETVFSEIDRLIKLDAEQGFSALLEAVKHKAPEAEIHLIREGGELILEFSHGDSGQVLAHGEAIASGAAGAQSQTETPAA